MIEHRVFDVRIKMRIFSNDKEPADINEEVKNYIADSMRDLLDDLYGYREDSINVKIVNFRDEKIEKILI